MLNVKNTVNRTMLTRVDRKLTIGNLAIEKMSF